MSGALCARWRPVPQSGKHMGDTAGAVSPAPRWAARRARGAERLPALDGAPNQGRHFRGEGDAKCLDLCHGSVPPRPMLANIANPIPTASVGPGGSSRPRGATPATDANPGSMPPKITGAAARIRSGATVIGAGSALAGHRSAARSPGWMGFAALYSAGGAGGRTTVLQSRNR